MAARVGSLVGGLLTHFFSSALKLLQALSLTQMQLLLASCWVSIWLYHLIRSAAALTLI